MFTYTPLNRLNVHERLRFLGMIALRSSKDWLTDEAKALEAFLRDLAMSGIAREGLLSREFGHEALGTGKWAMSGFVTIDIGHKLTSAILTTRASGEDVRAYTKLPWPAFVLRLPTDLLYMTNEVGIETPAQAILCFGTSTGNVGYALIGPSTMLWGHCEDLGAIAEMTASDLDLSDLPLERSSVDNRSDQLARNLIVGLCFHFSDARTVSKHVVDRGVRGERSTRQREPGQLPSYRLFELRAPVQCDVTAAIRAYVRHGGGHPTVQTLVRGHWRNVPHGPRRTLRRMQFIEPFWRGPVDAPVSARTGEES